ncbi:hypothetical protein [Lederbergia panacisoli]|uniref:hypothetical protein n=1 Tax=Lederbergia panacisoli TaxID=1255251 RepID=UPI00214B350D|nr:hypothetical protein [Lederbergia panacisoli]MCR2820048.1 hypothetical protein [Lederbergia panacisoli]
MDEQQCERIYQELYDIIEEIYSWEEIPKVLVNMFIDFRELDLFGGQYQDELKQHKGANKIYEAYVRILV